MWILPLYIFGNLAFKNISWNSSQTEAVITEICTFKTILRIYYISFLKFFGTKKEVGARVVKIERFKRAENFRKAEAIGKKEDSKLKTDLSRLRGRAKNYQISLNYHNSWR